MTLTQRIMLFVLIAATQGMIVDLKHIHPIRLILYWTITAVAGLIFIFANWP